MGLLEKLSQWLGGGAREVSVVVLGLDNSGKSSLLRALRPPAAAGPEPPPPPTVGAQQDHFTAGGVSFSAVEVGGGRRHRALWERHYRAADALIYVVDAADPLRLVVSRSELELVLGHAELARRRVPLLVLANKSDLPDALHHLQVAQALSLEQVAGVPWHICAASAASGAGLAEGVAWLARELRTTAVNRRGQH